ncbi:hypothetical protein ACFZAD_24545 [Streptomyces iakyrus]|uniref:hypothetical protein n=1 Tax=Streptomyces iakyrus TaxID=68219 RepID=UPI0036E06E1F
MDRLPLTLSRKQQTALNLLDDPYVVELLFGGGAGGGKSWLVSLWAVLQCRQYAGIRIGLGRKELTNLRKTTGQTLLGEVFPLLGVKEGRDFRYSPLVDPGIYFKNGSAILFVDLAPAPSDPNFDRLGSLNLTHVIIEEAAEIAARAKNVFSSRKNRKLNKEYGITGKAILTCNPGQNFVREQFYEPWLALGGGDAQVWPYSNDVGEPVLVEVNGVMHPAKRAYVKSLPTDNPFLSANYVQTLKSLGPVERRRLLKGDWDFDDDDAKLFKPYLFQLVDEVPDSQDNYGGCDPSRGGDACVFSHLKGNVVVDQVKLTIPRDDPNLDIGTYVAERYIEFCQQRGIGYNHAALDVVGIGASVLDACNRLGFHVRAFNAGSTHGIRRLDRWGNILKNPRPEDEAQTIPLFDMIRSQNFYDMAQAAHKGELLFLRELPYYAELKRDLADHKYETVERKTVVESKKRMKVRIGRSPDYADSLQSAWWVRANEGEQFDFAIPSLSDSQTMTGGLLEQTF